MPHPKRLPLLAFLTLATTAFAQFPGEPAPSPPTTAAASIHIIHPTLNKADHSITLPAAFWNEHLASWVEVALCGRPSDFLHETVVSVTTTKTILVQALRDIGCHDADAWADSIHEFPRIRGDQLMGILEVTRGGKRETYALDEQLSYEGWGISTGPYGWMFKGEPDEGGAERNRTPLPVGADDRAKIVRDDPQMAIVFKGIQHLSQSFADHPLAYDNWIYPMMRYERNYTLLPPAVYDSNGKVPVTLTLKKVTEEQLLTESAKLWHDKAYAQYILQQVPLARDVDAAKAEFWTLRQRYKDAAHPPADAENDRASLLVARIEKDYGELDAAWADYTVEHLNITSKDAEDAKTIRKQAELWKQHLDLERTRVEQIFIAKNAQLQQKALSAKQPEDAEKLEQLRGKEIEARSAALRADNLQPAEYWKEIQKGLDPKTDPRADWIRHVNGAVALAEARERQAKAGEAYGKLLQENAAGEKLTATQKAYEQALKQAVIDQTRLELVDTEFEISKREGITEDPDLPGLIKKRDALVQSLKEAGASTQP